MIQNSNSALRYGSYAEEHELDADGFDEKSDGETALDGVEVEAEVRPKDFLSGYLETLTLIERLHRLMLDVLKDEFERLGRDDVNSVQALLLFHIGEDELTVGDLKSRGYYQGSNVSYNLKKLVENGFLHHQRSRADRRSVRIRATAKGLEICEIVGDLFKRHSESIQTGDVISARQGANMNAAMLRLERFWRDRIRFIY